MQLPLEVSGKVFATSWGWAAVTATTQGLVRVVLPQSSRREAERALRSSPDSRLHRSVEDPVADIVRAAERQIAEYLEGRRRVFDLPLAQPPATRFVRAVWRGCCDIPYGETRAYGWLAAHVGRPAAMRAVGSALGANPLPLIVPCHRVIRSDGSLGGFGGGLPLKERLLALERAGEV